VRSEKVRGLFDELGLEPAGTMDALEPGRVVDHALAAVRDRDATAARLAGARERLAHRAAQNLRFVQRYWRGGG
jgi:hypothetical protein